MVWSAGRAAGLSRGETSFCSPHGPADLAALLSRRHDAMTLAALADVDPTSLKIRERIAQGVAARIDTACADEAAVRRWASFLSLPPNISLALRLAWESADTIWRWAGDTATDGAITPSGCCSGILTGAMASRLASGSRRSAPSPRRIDNVMAFEKWKATTRIRPAAFLNAAAGALGQARVSRVK